jgi:hypothetical protein
MERMNFAQLLAYGPTIEHKPPKRPESKYMNAMLELGCATAAQLAESTKASKSAARTWLSTHAGSLCEVDREYEIITKEGPRIVKVWRLIK